jgi:cyclopropane fatty-acyl-phospholipid synthase-like methyltransferase
VAEECGVDASDLQQRLSLPDYPRSARYDAVWVVENMMGPNPLWLTEWLCERIQLTPGMRVLDLGCGRALTSIFLAREFDVSVVACDLWIPARENWKRIEEAGESARVVPIHAEARALPFADDYFDAILSIDAYHYFGTDDRFLAEVMRFLGPTGQLGIVVPGFRDELGSAPPQWLGPYWEPDFCTLHSAEWWKRHWEKTGLVDVAEVDVLANGAKQWLAWSEAVDDWAIANGREPFKHETEMLRADKDETLCFVRVVARGAADE